MEKLEGKTTSGKDDNQSGDDVAPGGPEAGVKLEVENELEPNQQSPNPRPVVGAT